jgi:asparagine synthase (glutamine-hydrolysing)
MCGLVGLFAPDTRPTALKAQLPAMLAAMAHRGPDADGTWAEDEIGLALGHLRLAILDLSEAGAQPMHSHTGRYVLSYNGEIYNHLELRAGLEQHGISWRGTSDTETLLAMIEHVGMEETLKRAVGMFAVALWDRRHRRLTLARDRFGEKPLYYAKAGKTLIFASDLAACEKANEFDRTIDRAALYHYTRRGWQSPDRTIWASAKKVPPGGWVTFNVDLERTHGQYWNATEEIAAARANALPISLKEASEQLEALLGKAVKRQMISDVPLGAWLSGGIDSSTVVAMMQQHSSQPIRTFSIGFSEEAYDEARHARAVAAHLGTNHSEVILSPEDAMALIPNMPSSFSEPFSDASLLPTMLLAQMTREHVTVALTGDGADELFGGYNRHVLADQFARLREMAGGLGHLAMHAAAALPSGALRRLAGWSGHNIIQFDDKYRKLQGLLKSDTLSDMYSTTLDRRPPNQDIPLITGDAESLYVPKTIDGLNPGAQLMHFDTMVYLPEDVLVKVDRSAMSASLETRAPFLDPDLFRLAWQLPTELKISGKRNKIVLRTLLDRHVPPELANRPKQGFSIPIGPWLTGPLQGWAEDLLADMRSSKQDLLNIEAAEMSWCKLKAGDLRYGDTVWDLLVFLCWAESRGVL